MTKEMVTKETKLPAHLQQHAGVGAEDFDISELRPPRIEIGQFVSKVVKDKLCEAGEIYNSVSKEVFGNEVTIIVCKKEIYWIHFPTKEEKRENSDAPIKTSKDGICWDNGTALTAEDKWKTQAYRFYVVVRGNEQPIPFSVNMMKMSRKTGQEISSQIGYNTTAKVPAEPIFAHAYKLTVRKDSKGDDEYFVWEAQPAGWATESEANLAANLRKMIETSNVVDDVVEKASTSDIDIEEDKID